ncbi:MAG TPA: hypothetical protein QF564_12395 [Pirellulaceae bacterium]|nr:hypothetical protein [Pirellulaceae bacterium]
MRPVILFACLAALLPAFGGAVYGAERRLPLLNVSKGELPNDTALERQSKLTIEDAPRELGGKALKVVYADGDSFGMSRGASERNWKPFAAVEFSAFNPSQRNVRLSFAVRHRGTAGFRTRVDLPVTLKPGKNDVRLSIDEIMNVNGSKPDLSDVVHWYLACESGQTPTLFFSDFWLVGGDTALTAGRTGNPTLGKSDPARLARIRAAKMPKFTQPLMFNTPEADAVLSALEVFPADNAFNQLVNDWPHHPNSKNIIASIGADKPFRYNPDMGFILVPPDQPRVAVKIVEYPGESDAGPYPVPENIPIEGWPAWHQRANTDPPTLAEVQRRPAQYEGDRHAIVVDPVNRMMYEFFTFGKTANGWAAGQASVFDLKTNKLRPDGWTSADAAGLPIFPAVVRYDEIQRGIVEHAMRVTVRRTRRAYVHPATHFASRLTDENLPRMGERLRLRADFDISEFSPSVQAILKGLKKYGMFVADNGIDWAISVAPDPRIPVLHEELRKIRGSDFEVVVAP